MNVLEQDTGDSYWKNRRAECLKQVQVTIIIQAIISNFRSLNLSIYNSCHDYLLTLCSAVQ